MGIIIGVLSGLLWGLNDVFTNIYSQMALSSSTTIAIIVFALFLSLMQDAFSSTAIFSYHASRKQFNTHLRATSAKSIWLLVLAAICAGPLGMVAGIAGIAYAGPIYAGVVTSCYPVVALILSILFLRERPTRIKIIGIILSVIAVIFISIAGERSGIENITIGLIFAACAMLGWGMESVLFSLAAKCSDGAPSWLLAIRQSASALSYIILLVVFTLYAPAVVQTVLLQLFVPMLIAACVISASTSYLAYYHAIKRIGASLGTTFNASFIFWAGIFSILFNIASIHLSFVLWGAMLILGIYFATYGTVQRNRVGIALLKH
ncbi:MAG: DMT family transporter [Francisellaceae bacterium]